MKKTLLILVLIAALGTVSAQELRTYQLTCDPGEFTYLISHPEENQPIVCSVEYEAQQWNNVELSLRGEPYLNEPKKSFSLAFPDTNLFLGRRQMVLAAEWNDPTFSREFLAYDLFNRAGLEAPESWFIRLDVNGVYIGLYLDIEVIDEHFLARAGLPDGCSIYRADQLGCLLSPDDSLASVWVKETNSQTGYYDLANLVLWLDTVHEDFFYDQLWERFAVAELPRVIATNALIGNRSVYYDHYTLIHDLNPSGIWHFVPWEADSCFVYDLNYRDPDYFRCGHPQIEQTNVLVNQCWRRQDIHDLILNQINGMMDTLFTQAYYQEMTDSLTTLLWNAVAEDTAKQFSVDDFLNGLAEIPDDIAGRSSVLSDRLDHQPLPFDFNPAILTPGGVYFSWDQTRIADGAPVSYTIELADDPLFETPIMSFAVGNAVSYLTNEVPAGDYYWRVQAFSPSGDSTQSLTYYAPLSVPENAFQGTVWRDPIVADTTWTSTNGPYSLPDGLNINAGATLTIAPGVLVGIGTGKSIFIQGGLTAIGTAEDSIRFVPLNPDTFWGAFYAEYPTGDITLAFNSILGGSNIDSGQGTPAAMKIGYGVLNIFDTHFRLCDHAALTAAYTDVHLERVDFDHFSIRPVIVLAGSAIIRSCSFSHSSPVLGSGLCEVNATEGESEISGCEFYDCSDDALDFDDTHAPVTISRNIITGADDKGISIGDQCTDITVSNCVITDSDIGIGIYSTTNATLYNNVIVSNGEGLALSVHGPTGQTIARNNIIWNNNVDISAPLGTNLTLEYSLTGDAYPYPGQGNLNGDPQFVDANNDNFFPAEGSPLIDAGFGTGAPDQDLIFSDRYDVLNVPNSGAGDIDYVDIGVFEFRPELYPGVEPERGIPDDFVLLENFPNPFNGNTRINFSLPVSGWASVTIYDILGRQVFQRRFDRLLPGNHSLIWNSRNYGGNIAASGIYFCCLETRDVKRAIKIILLK